MLLRMSTLLLRTLREDPADAEVPSHRLLVRAGYIRRAAPGGYTWLPLGRLVVPLDLSKPSRGALDAALAWAEALGHAEGNRAELNVVHVLPRSFAGNRMESGRARVGPELHQVVVEAVRVAGAAGDVVVREDLLWGEHAAAEIVRYAEGADLIVMATHGYGAVRRALLGSVAGAVARDAQSCVLLIPPTLWGESGPE